MEATTTAAAATATSKEVVARGSGFRPPLGFTDSRELSEMECEREQLALDLEVQRVMESKEGQLQKMDKEELTSLLARYNEKKEQERQEYTIHV